MTVIPPSFVVTTTSGLAGPLPDLTANVMRNLYFVFAFKSTTVKLIESKPGTPASCHEPGGVKYSL